MKKKDGKSKPASKADIAKMKKEDIKQDKKMIQKEKKKDKKKK